jgi:hypothetical protein
MNLKKLFLLLASALLIFSVISAAIPVSAGIDTAGAPCELRKTAVTSFTHL